MANRLILQQGTKRGPSRSVWQAGLLLCFATAACGQATTSAVATAAPPFTVHEVAKFSSPWAMAFLPGSGVRLTGSALLTEKDGKLWLVDTATGKRQAVAGVPTAHVAGQGGLGDVVVHPEFAANRRVYLTFVEKGAGGSGAAMGYGTLEQGAGGPRLDGLQDDLAPVAQGRRQWPFQSPHRLCARREPVPEFGRPPENRPGAGPGQRSARSCI